MHKLWVNNDTTERYRSFLYICGAGLLDLYCGLFNKSSKYINRVQVSRILFTVVQGCCLQAEGLSHGLFKFFRKALSNTRFVTCFLSFTGLTLFVCYIYPTCFVMLILRAEKQLMVLENLVTAANVFLRSVVLSSRKRVCALGEDVLPSMLYVYTQMRPISVLKEELVKFFYLQICVHHPKGAKTPETGTETTAVYNTSRFGRLVKETCKWEKLKAAWVFNVGYLTLYTLLRL